MWFVHLQTSISWCSFECTAEVSLAPQEVQITVRDLQHLWPIQLCLEHWWVLVNSCPFPGFPGVMSEISAGNAQCSQHLLFWLLSVSSLRFLPECLFISKRLFCFVVTTFLIGRVLSSRGLRSTAPAIFLYYYGYVQCNLLHLGSVKNSI